VKSLADDVQAHSKRVGEYLDVLFIQCCMTDIYLDDAKARVRLREDHRNVISLSGQYHDLGKALVPEPYQTWREDFSPEETALFRRHTQDSVRLIDTLFGANKTYKNVELNFFREVCESHHERWDGTGFPGHLKGTNIPILGRMCAICDCFDHYVMERRSETPFDDAMERIQAEAGTNFDPEIVEVFKTARPRLRKIFSAHIEKSRVVPTTDTFIRRTVSRPFSLVYRPILERKNGNRSGFEASMRFRVREDWKTYEEVAPLIKREKLQNDLGSYFILEACDAINRFNACSIPCDYVAVEIPGGYMSRKASEKEIEGILKDTGVEPKQLCLEVPQEDFLKQTKGLLENIADLQSLGVRILFKDMLPTELTVMDAKDFDGTYISIGQNSQELLEDPRTERIYASLAKAGAVLLSNNLDRKKDRAALSKLGVTLQMGPVSGDYEGEDILVDRELKLQVGA